MVTAGGYQNKITDSRRETKSSGLVLRHSGARQARVAGELVAGVSVYYYSEILARTKDIDQTVQETLVFFFFTVVLDEL